MRPHDSDLMMLHDGELDAAARRELETGLSAAQRDAMAGLEEVGEVVRGHLELSADEVPGGKLDALWREIDKGIDRAEREAAPAARAADARDQPGRVGHGAPAVPRGRVARWLERFRGHVITGVISAGAVAALAMVLRDPERAASPRAGEVVRGGGGSGAVTGPGGSGDAAPRLVTHRPSGPSEPTELDALDTPGGTGTVFSLEDEDGSTTVIWVTPEDTVEGI